jgi:hypothetical protein
MGNLRTKIKIQYTGGPYFLPKLYTRLKRYSRKLFSVTVPLTCLFCLKHLKGQSHEKVDELRVWGVSLGPN